MWQLRRIGMIAGRGALDAAAAVGGTAFDPSNTAVAVSLSNGNLTATGSGGSVQPGTSRTVQSHVTTGKYYAEFTCDSVSGGKVGIGVVNSSQIIGGSGNGIGSSGNSIGYYSDANVYRNAYTVGATYSTFTTGDVISVALDVSVPGIWWRKNAGIWLGGGDPATGTGAVTTGVPTGALFFAVECERLGDTVTANFGATAFAQTAPSGFGNF
jgi:hypothetical protein